ncbi:hypothetical protein LZ198_27585 [Myxococcus sp. K15C18031901]|uniref:hypothetical protein n=1 Tax=Myxococcus dinghuensis TaxID=2906761 RepID=UPI0020A715A7|nr:hypothetical protein [Myxococcus dinghuensis]MCP3102643.1 hypothetical protein [Myxococcus dinghuensis]
MVSLWDMLTLMSWSAAMGGAAAAAQIQGGGVARYVLAGALGCGLGVLAVLAIRRMGAYVFSTLPPDDPANPAKKPPVRLTLTYVGAGVWWVPVTALSMWTVGFLLTWTFP